MEDIRISEFQKIIPGKKYGPVLSLSKGYFRMNGAFKRKHGLAGKRAVEIHGKVVGNKLLIALKFLDTRSDGTFTVSHYDRNDSASFSARILFTQFEMNHSDIKKIKNLPVHAREEEGHTYLITEVPLNKD